MIHAISVGFDSSEGSHKAVDFAVGEALAHDALLRIVSCLEVPLFAGDPCMTVEELADRRIAAASSLAALEEHLMSEWPDLKLDAQLIDESARKGLREESGRTDLLVIGREGVNRALPWLVGSTARSLSRHSHCPVAVVPKTWVGCSTTRVLAGVEGDRKSLPTMRFAADLAESLECQLTVAAKELSEAMLIARYYFGGEVGGLRAEHDLTGVLIGAAKPDDVIVFGTRHHGRFASSLFGSPHDPIVERSLVPVILVPEPVQ